MTHIYSNYVYSNKITVHKIHASIKSWVFVMYKMIAYAFFDHFFFFSFLLDKHLKSIGIFWALVYVCRKWLNKSRASISKKKNNKKDLFEMSTLIKTKHPAFNTQQQLIIYIRAWNFRLIGIGLRKIYSTKNYITLSCHGHHRRDIDSLCYMLFLIAC